jgi:hypothetical protein
VVAEDGRRFFFNAPYEHAEPRAINVVLNWVGAVKR